MYISAESAEPAAFCELFSPSHVFHDRKLECLLPSTVTMLTHSSIDIDKSVETKLQLFLSGILAKMLGVPIDRYYLRFEQNEGEHDRKTILMINYRDKIAQNPYERMQSLKRSKKVKKGNSCPQHGLFVQRVLQDAKTSFAMHTSVAEVGVRSKNVP